MPSTYTLNNGIELIGTGEQSGTWGDTTNTNFGLVDVALDGQTTVTLASAGSSGSPNPLPISDGAASNGRNRMIIFDDSSDLGAAAYVQLTPNDAEKIVYVRNDLSGSRGLVLFQGTYNVSNDYVVPAGTTAVVYFDGAGSGAVAANVFNNAHFDAVNVVGNVTVGGNIAVTGTVDAGTVEFDNLSGTGSVTVTDILDQDNMASNSATALATQQSIKAYVDSQVTAQDLDFAGGTGTGSVDLDSQTFTVAGTANEIETSASGQTITVGLPNAVTIASLTATSADINGGTIDGTTIATSDITVGSGKTLNVSGGTLTLANNQISGDKIEGGTIGSVTITTADINGGNIDGTIIGATTPAVGTFTSASTTGNFGVGTSDFTTDLGYSAKLKISGSGPVLFLEETDTGQDWAIAALGSSLVLRDATAGSAVGAFTATGLNSTVIGATTPAAITGTTITASTSLGGTLSTAAQPNVTSVGSLTSLDVTGTVTSASVGIGADSPAYDLVIEKGSPTLQLLATGTNVGTSRIFFGDADTAVRGQINYTHADDNLSFTVNAQERMRIDASGNVGIGTTSDQSASATNEGIWLAPGTNSSFSANSTPLTINRMGTGGNDRANITLHNNGTARADIGTLGASNGMYIAVGGSERMRLDASGNVLVGTTTVTQANVGGATFAGSSLGRNILKIGSTSTLTGVELVQFFNPNGQVGRIETNASSTSYVTSSDYRLKENVVVLTGAAARVNQLKPSRFNFIADGTDTVVDGFLAHEVATVVPEAISGTKDAVDADGNPDYQGIDQSKLVPLLTAALQEALTKIDALETRITALEG